jgi:hypothetical protein
MPSSLPSGRLASFLSEFIIALRLGIMKKTLSSIVLLVLATIPLFACGGGGGGYSAPATVPANTLPTRAVVKLFTQGTLTAGTKIGAIDVIVNLPTGVSVKSTGTTPETDPGVVIASGVAQNSLVVGNYSAPTATTPANVRLALINVVGFGIGEFATVNCDIAAGSNPVQAGFTLSNLAISDTTGTAISGPTSVLTAVFQ